jgi:hypothetical protein
MRLLANIVAAINFRYRFFLLNEIRIYVPYKKSHRDIQSNIACLPFIKAKGQLSFHFGGGGYSVVTCCAINVKKPHRHGFADDATIQLNCRLNGGT